VFRSARIRLTILYTLGIALVMAAFSVALYFALAAAMSSNLDVSGDVSAQVEQTILESQLARARLALAGINLGGWMVAATISYFVAGRTLAPLEAALARQRQFTAHASHELRTPLTVIKGEIDVTQARERTPAHYRQTLERIDKEVMRLESTIGDLLTLARLEAGQNNPLRDRRAIGDVINEVVAELDSHSLSTDVRVEVSVPADLEAMLDWPRIRYLLLNLLNNAIQHTPPGGRIRVLAHAQSRWLELSVFNSGSSIDPSDLPYLFLPFYRGKGASMERGTGLGLALCEWIVRAHGGSISAHNADDGVVFLVRLPRH
jgi:signal transduction histidine kinase